MRVYLYIAGYRVGKMGIMIKEIRGRGWRPDDCPRPAYPTCPMQPASAIISSSTFALLTLRQHLDVCQIILRHQILLPDLDNNYRRPARACMVVPQTARILASGRLGSGTCSMDTELP